MKEIISKIEKAFEKSDIKNLTKDIGEKHFYSVCASKPKKGQPLIIGFNWNEESGKLGLQDISILPDKIQWSDLGSLSKIKNYIKINFLFLELENFNQTNYCFFRSNNENQLTQKDIKLCEPIFEEFVALLKPQIMFGFSVRLTKYLISNNKIKYLDNKIIPNEKSTILLYKGFIKLGNWWTYIYLLPHPNSWIYKEKEKTLNAIWKFARQTYSYECQFTDFLNFLESKDIHPILSENPIEEQGIKEQLQDNNSINFPNLNIHDIYRSILPNNFDIYDIAILNRFFIQNRGYIEKTSIEFNSYLKRKPNSEIFEIINDLFDKDDFYNTFSVTKMSLQRFYIANKFPNEYNEYKKIINEKNHGYWEPIMC